jgi:mitochondrial enoyl-[acyl-carrier protein] reductase / trans-2-enoyl-CoA reductase
MNRVLCHYQYGVPETVITLEERPLPNLCDDEILIKTILAPINPADINMIEGRYGEQPPLPAILGNEGVGVITKIGANVNHLSVGDQVITPAQRATWCEYRICKEVDAVMVPPNILPEVACMLNINPLTALLMLDNFYALQPGDWIIQNAANSGIGRAVIDIAQHIGIKTINIVRSQKQVTELKEIGGDMQLTFDDLKAKTFQHELKNLPIRLALNAVGGESSRLITRTLSQGGVMLSYGAMSKEPVILDNGPLIFKEITIKGFWRTRWVHNADHKSIQSVFERLLTLAERGAFSVPIEKKYPFVEASQALKHAQQSGRKGKILLYP